MISSFKKFITNQGNFLRRSSYIYTKEIVSHSIKTFAMKIQTNKLSWLLSVICIGAIIFTLVAWAGNPPSAKEKPTTDTIPAKERSFKEKKVKDFDREIKQLEDASSDVEDLKSKDWDKIRREIEESIDKIDFDKIKLDAQKAIRDIDVEKIQREVEESISKIDFDKIEKEIRLALKDVHVKFDKEELEGLKEELKKARKEIHEELNKQELRKDMEKFKKLDLKDLESELEEARKEIEKAKSEIDLDRLDMKKEMEDAKIDIQEAKKELKGYQEMIYEMEEEDLLNTGDDYKVSFINDELYINDKRQPDSTTEKYRNYFKKRNITIEKRNGRMHIEHDKRDKKRTSEI